MASSSSGSSHLGMTDNQKRWLVAGIALNKILIPQIRPFVEQEIDKEYNNLMTSHNIHTQSTPGRLQRWPPRKFLKYENINGNDLQPKLPGGRYDYSLFDCRVSSHVDFARLYVENYMAKFNAFDDHCDASAVLLLLGGVPVFLPAVQAAAGDVRTARNDWAHCVFSKWDPTKFQQSFSEMEDLVRVMALPAADEGKLLGELKDWETKGIQLCMNSPVDPALLQLVEQNIKSLQDDVNNMSAEFGQEKVKVQQELQNVATILKEMKERVQKLEDNEGEANRKIQKLESHTGQIEGRVDKFEYRMDDFQGEANRKIQKLESHSGQIEGRVDKFEYRMDDFQEKIDDLTSKSQESASFQDPVEEDSPASPFAGPTDPKRRKTETFPLEECQERLNCIYRDHTSFVTIIPWKPQDDVHIDEIYTQPSIYKDNVKPGQLIKKKLGDYTEIFTCQQNAKRILVYGRPGIGKSTFCQKVAYDWSQKSKQILSKFDLVLQIKLRDVCNQPDVSSILRDSKLLPNDSNISVASLYAYIHDKQDKVLILLDGYDEYSHDMRKSPVYQIWCGNELSNCTIVLTMRSPPELKSSLRFEISGFDSKLKVEEFSRKFLKDDSDFEPFYEDLKKYNLTEIAEIPLLLKMLCLLWREQYLGENSPSRANIYTHFINAMLAHFSTKEDPELCKIEKVDEYAEELSKLGKLAYDALLKGNFMLLKSEVTDDFQIIIDKLTKVGLCHPLKPWSVDPKECISFIHKSIPEYLAGMYLKDLAVVRNDETFLSELDSIETILKMAEVLKFASELSDHSACAILNHLGGVAKKTGLTANQESIAMEETPALMDVKNDDFLMFTVDIFLCCSAEMRKTLFPTFLSYIGGVLLINFDQLHRIANEHLLESTEPPNLIFFPDELGKHPERDYSDLVSVMEHLKAVVVSSSGRQKASEFLDKYSFRPISDFFLKKEENIMHLYFAAIVDYDEELTQDLGGKKPFLYPTEMLKEVIASPESTAQQRNKSDAHQSSKQNTRTTVCPTQDTETHCLSLAWTIMVERQALTKVVPLVNSPRNVFIQTAIKPFEFSNINFTDKLDALIVAPFLTDDMSAALTTCLRQSPNLRELDLAGIDLGEKGTVLNSLLDHVPDLEKLHLQTVKMTKTQVYALTTVVSQTNISTLMSRYHDRKGKPLPEDQWPSEDFWEGMPFGKPTGLSADHESEDEPGSSAESEDEPGSSAESPEKDHGLEGT